MPNRTGIAVLRRYWGLLGTAFILGVLIGQFLLAHQWTEPYPAFIFPGFSNVPFAEGKVQTLDVRTELVDAGGTVHEVSHQHLFDTVPPVHSFLLLRRLFAGRSIVGDSLRSGPHALEASPLPDYHAHRSRADLQAQLRHYLRRRSAALGVPTADTLRVTWIQRVVARDGSEQQTVQSTRTFPLTP